jgi:DNA-binding MarR family transcriptional regulator
LSSQNELSKLTHEELLQAALRAVYESSTTAVFFHTAVAEQVGLGPTEEKTVLILSGLGPLTAGEIAQHTGLTTAAVTNLIDRLESKGFVQRVRDTKDRRRVIVELNQARLAELMRVFASLQGIFDDLLTAYSDDQLAAIVDYLTRATKASREAVARLSEKSKNPVSD